MRTLRVQPPGMASSSSCPTTPHSPSPSATMWSTNSRLTTLSSPLWAGRRYRPTPRRMSPSLVPTAIRPPPSWPISSSSSPGVRVRPWQGWPREPTSRTRSAVVRSWPSSVGRCSSPTHHPQRTRAGVPYPEPGHDRRRSHLRRQWRHLQPRRRASRSRYRGLSTAPVRDRGDLVAQCEQDRSMRTHHGPVEGLDDMGAGPAASCC